MNNPHIKEFLDAIEKAAPLHIRSNLAFLAQRAIFCPQLKNVSELVRRAVPKEQRLQLTGKQSRRDTMCIAGNMVFTFSFDDIPVITSKNDKPLLPKKMDKENLDDLIRISEDFYYANGDWPEYKEQVESSYKDDEEDEEDEEEEYGIELPDIDNTLVGETPVDEDNVRILPASQGFSGDDDFMRHINANADFFKRLIELGKATRNTWAHSRDQYHQFEDGVAFAMPITVDMFVDCNETEMSRQHRRSGFWPKVGVEEANTLRHIGAEINTSFTITKKGLFCMDLEGEYFVMVGFKDTDKGMRYSDKGMRYSDKGMRYFIVDTVSLAIPFGQPRPTPYSPFANTPSDLRMDSQDERFVAQFVRSVEVQSLDAAAFGTLLEKAKSIARKYENLRYLPKQLNRSRLVLVQGNVLYITTRRTRADMLRDFPQYVNRRIPEEDRWFYDSREYEKAHPHELPINEKGVCYRIDDTRGSTNQDVVGVGIDYCGFLDGKKVQPIRYIKSDGSFFTKVVDFVYPFDLEPRPKKRRI